MTDINKHNENLPSTFTYFENWLPYSQAVQHTSLPPVRPSNEILCSAA